jgi:glycosyltransferase involved in cell wall biosynthesis
MEKKMHIAMLAWESSHSVSVGGVSPHVSELAATLARQGHEVHVITRLAPGQGHYDLIDGVHYQRCPYPGHPDFVEDVNNMCRAFVDRVFAIEDLRGRPFDVVHAHDWLTANAMIWIKRGRGRRGVFTVHSTEYGRCGNVFYDGRAHRIRHQERAGTYWADHVIAVSRVLRDEIAWMYEVPLGKTSVIYNGASPHRFDHFVDPGSIKRQYGIGPMDPTVLYSGRLEWQKGPDLLVEAIPAVLRAHRAAKFVFAGDGSMRGPLERRAHQLGVAHATRFLGRRNGGDLVNLYKMCETLCVPSRNEPFGIVVLEAWSAGKPVVVSQAGGPNEYVTHEINGLKIYPHPGSVVWGLTTLFSNFDWARWMGRNGRYAVESRFAWERIAEQTLGAYDPQYAATVRSPAARSEESAAQAAPSQAPVPVAASTRIVRRRIRPAVANAERQTTSVA